jgi:hypothetical protein
MEQEEGIGGHRGFSKEIQKEDINKKNEMYMQTNKLRGP